jgi:hypothetical protein
LSANIQSIQRVIVAVILLQRLAQIRNGTVMIGVAHEPEAVSSARLIVLPAGVRVQASSGSKLCKSHLAVGAAGWIMLLIGCQRARLSAAVLSLVAALCFTNAARAESQVIGVGPQVGYLFPAAGVQGYINLKGYGEFDGVDRMHGWNAWLTLSPSPSLSPAPPSAQAPAAHYYPAAKTVDAMSKIKS